ncbi:hypothetical protein BOTCAL_0565g00010 [Botryotinia calthae]|uniref:Uncharacterized protein n=1 Tax=Botryotinia calthae TaxID=38488 RepID=A0A4Y8CKC9_9HELO|nr:hypothetical protein BOTCAL_0565g00010 [Botryotinia calthae]
MDIASLLAPGNGGRIGAPFQASQGTAAPMNSASIQSDQLFSNTNSAVLESDALLETIVSVNKLTAEVMSDMEIITLNRLRHGSQNKSNYDKTLHLLEWLGRSLIQSVLQSSI